MIYDFLGYFLIFSVAIIWFYCSGLLLFKLLKVNIPSIQLASLLNLLIGIVVHVILYSIYKTHFATFNILLLAILLLILREYRLIKKSDNAVQILFKDHFKKIIELLFIALVFLVLNIFTTVEPEIYPYFHVARDDIFYSQVSTFISGHGVESFYLDWPKSSKLGIIPYHYFELWLNDLLAKITGLLSVQVYIFVTCTIILILFYQSVMLIMSKALGQALNFRHKIICFALLFMGDISFGLISRDSYPNLTGGLALYYNHKTILIFIIITLAWLAWKNKYFPVAFLLLLIAPLLNYGLMPVILCSVPAFFVLHYRFLKTGEIIEYKKILLYYGAYLIGLICIRKLFPNPFDGVTTLGLKDLLLYYNEFDKFKTFVHNVLNYILKMVLLLMPFLVVIVPLKKKGLLAIRSGFNLLMLIILISSLALSAVLHFLLDTSQLFTITVNILFHWFLFYGISLLLFRIQREYFYKLLVIIYLISGFWMLGCNIVHKDSRIVRYSEQFLKDVQSVSANVKGEGIRYLHPDYYQSAYDINPNTNYEGYYLSYLKDNIVIHTVSVRSIPDKKELHDYFNFNKKLILKSSYYLYFVHVNKMENADDGVAQLAFIRENKIDFIVSTRNAIIPDILNDLVSVRIEDQLSGEKLMLLDRNKLKIP